MQCTPAQTTTVGYATVTSNDAPARAEHPGSMPTVLNRGSDIVAVVGARIDLSQSAQSLCSMAAIHCPQLPSYRPDGAGAIVIFHTEKGNFVLGSVRANPALQAERAPGDRPYPLQINTCLGGFLPDPETPLRTAILAAARPKVLRENLRMETPEATRTQSQLSQMLDAIEADAGWEPRLCIHTDKWTEKAGNERTMCFLTAVKHLQCSEADRATLEQAFKLNALLPSESGREAMAFGFASLDATANSALDTYAADELTKALRAWETHGETVAVVFNDLTTAALKKNRAFECDSPARLTLNNF